MNLRFDQQSLRFRLDGEEFQRLAAGETLATQTRLGPTVFTYRVAAKPASATPLRLICTTADDAMMLDLEVNAEGLAQLNDPAHRKDGLAASCQLGDATLAVALDVDLKSHKPKAG